MTENLYYRFKTKFCITLIPHREDFPDVLVSPRRLSGPGTPKEKDESEMYIREQIFTCI